MKIYQLPTLLRAIGPRVAVQSEWRNIDDIGYLVRYDTKETPSDAKLRSFLSFVTKVKKYISANDPYDALARFDKLPGPNTGGRYNPNHRAWRIDDKHPIIELPSCALLHTNYVDDFICGEEDIGRGHAGEFGMCVIEGFDPPDFFCPISDALEKVTLRTIAENSVEYCGTSYPVITAHQLTAL